MVELDFSGKEQLYYQLYSILFQDIVSGKYGVGTLIPSESELMRRYGTSRATARKAMEILANDGLIVKRQGRGSEVISNNPMKSSPQRAVRYLKKGVDRELPTEKQVVQLTTMPAQGEFAEALKVGEGTPLFRLTRVFSVAGEATYIESNYLVEARFPQLGTRDFAQDSLRAYLTNVCGVKWLWSREQIFAVSAAKEQARLLGVAENSPLLLVKRRSVDVSDTPLEYVLAHYRADRYHLEIDLNI
ncbi:MAG: GntR family transcriptional regulator [Propionicimonas sp.]